LPSICSRLLYMSLCAHWRSHCHWCCSWSCQQFDSLMILLMLLIVVVWWLLQMMHNSSFSWDLTSNDVNHGHLMLYKGLDHKDLKRTHHMCAFKERTTMDFESQVL
jgi:hypothetical protein